MKGGHSQRRRFSLQALCVVHSPTEEESSSGGIGDLAEEDPCLTPNSSNRQSAKWHKPTHNETSASLQRSGSKKSANLAPPSAPVKSHYKVVVMGSAKVGKTSLVAQFLYAAYSPRYRPTVEDMHTVELDCQGLDLRLDILDTGGSYVFPAMRSLAIQSADGFILVCSADDPASLEEVEHCRSQILERKGVSCPLVVVLNKKDLIRSGSESSESSISGKTSPEEQTCGGNGSNKTATALTSDKKGALLCPEMVESLVTCDWNNGFVLASAKSNYNVTQVFQELFVQAKSRIALSPAVRKRRQSLPARSLQMGINGSPLHSSHHVSLHGSNAAAAAAAAAATATATAANNHSTPIISAKRNSCTIS